MQPYGKEARIYDPSVNGRYDTSMYRGEWISRFYGKYTRFKYESVTPGSCYVDDSFTANPRRGCQHTELNSSKLARNIEDMPEFRMIDLNRACSVLHGYLGHEVNGFSAKQLEEKRGELSRMVSEIAIELSKKNILEGDPSQFQCGL